MSIANVSEQLYYPESDGKPMGETDLHRNWMFRILEIFKHRYRGQKVYVASNLLIYYEPGKLKKFVVPDDFVVVDCEPGLRRVFKTWEERRVPTVVFEVTSRKTKKEDLVDKPSIYKKIGVKEYFLYDPTGAYLENPLQGFRLIDGDYVEISHTDGSLRCESLGIGLRLNDDDLEMFDNSTGALLLTDAEAAHAAKETEHAAKEAERAAKEVERAARLIAEAKVRELETEIERLRQQQRRDS